MCDVSIPINKALQTALVPAVILLLSLKFENYFRISYISFSNQMVLEENFQEIKGQEMIEFSEYQNF